MKDYLISLEKLRRDAAEAALIRDLATNKTKRELFDQLHQHYNVLADQVQQAINKSEALNAMPDNGKDIPPPTTA